MLENLTFYLILVIITVLLVMLAKKIKVAYPVLLVLAGLVISFIPGTPTIHIEPELIFFIFLPPLLYEAAWATSWKELWRWRFCSNRLEAKGKIHNCKWHLLLFRYDLHALFIVPVW